ncbi:MAG: MBL fold metallo-hydrolase [Candidatus Neomarinimicrobiota bacterium]
MTNSYRRFKVFLLTLCWLLVGFTSAQVEQGTALVHEISKVANRITVTILYDNTSAVDEVQEDWGFACLVEGMEQTVLFDTGTKSEVLLHNAEVLGKDLGQVDVLVLSHDHGDHTGGIVEVLEHNPEIEVYFPVSFPATYDSIINSHDAKPVRVSEAIEIFEGATLTGEMGGRIKEQSLILETTPGLVIITGCSHQGIVKILERAKNIYQENITLVFGGFHLLNNTADQVSEIITRFKDLGVEKVGATHCTGERAIELFRKAYGDNFVPMGTGRVVQIPKQ